jgi:hypothetical protein
VKAAWQPFARDPPGKTTSWAGGAHRRGVGRGTDGFGRWGLGVGTGSVYRIGLLLLVASSPLRLSPGHSFALRARCSVPGRDLVGVRDEGEAVFENSRQNDELGWRRTPTRRGRAVRTDLDFGGWDRERLPDWFAAAGGLLPAAPITWPQLCVACKVQCTWTGFGGVRDEGSVRKFRATMKTGRGFGA